MKAIKPLNLAVLHRPYSDGQNDVLAVAGIILMPFANASQPVPEPALWKFVSTQLGTNATLDAAMPKMSGEFVMTGRCHAPGSTPVTLMPVRVKVGELEKTLTVAGDRHWTRVRDDWNMSEPVPFTELELSYTNAFGGAGFARNPLGKGMPPGQEGEPCPLPNVFASSMPVVSVEDRPEPAGFAPIDMAWPQRFEKAGTYDEQWRQTRFPGFAADMDWRIFNTAPPDQWLPGFLRGDEPVEIDGMHPLDPNQRTALPGYAARCFITEHTSGQQVFREVPMRAETLWLFPNAEHMALIFRGTVAIASDDASSVLHLVAGLEALNAPKPVEHYQAVLAQRLDKRRGAVHALNDAPLLPECLKDASPLSSIAETSATRQPQGFMEANQRRNAERELERAKQQLTAQRAQLLETARQFQLPPPDLSTIDKALAQTLPPEMPAPRLDQLPQVLDEADREIAQARADALVKKAEAERSMRSLCDEQGLDYDALSRPKAPPLFKAADVLEKLRTADAAMKTFGGSNPDIARMLADPELRQRLDQAEQSALDTYRRSAQHFRASGAGAQSLALREQVVAGLARGASFAGQDLTAADLSGLDLSNADFSEALMESVQLTDARLTGARLNGALLAHAALGGADLSKADLSGANFGKASMVGIRAQGANFSRAILDEADLTGADLSDAQLAGASLASARLNGATFARVSAPKLKFIDMFGSPDGMGAEGAPSLEDLPGMDLRGLDFSGADLEGALFLNTRLDGACLSGARLAGATLLGGSAEGTDFSGADLTGLRVVRGSRLDGANFAGADLRRANLRGIAMDRVNLAGARLEEADLSDASLQQAVLTEADAAGLRAVKADFSEARMERIDLRGAVLQKAQFAGADVRDSNLYMADLVKVRGDAQTLFDGANLGRTTLKGNGQ